MNNVKKLINQTNSKRIKNYYTLTELKFITGMSLRSLKYRMKDIKEKYNNVPMLLHKVGKYWQIHYTLVEEFKPKYVMTYSKLFDHHWSSLCTWNPLYNYDIDYHIELIHEIKNEAPNNSFAYVIEQDQRNNNHTHLISDLSMEKLDEIVKKVLTIYIENPKEIQIKTETINNRHNVVTYLMKTAKKSGIIN